MNPQHQPDLILKQAQLIHSQAAVDAAMRQMANAINARYAGQEVYVLSVMTGASYMLGQMLPMFNFCMQLGYVQATRYRDGTQGGQIAWLAKPTQSIKAKHVLIVDDILDEGITLKAIVDVCAEMGAASIATAVLVEKELATPKPIQADFVGLQVPNKYVFGCGMDAYGWWRNLPAIYALHLD